MMWNAFRSCFVGAQRLLVAPLVLCLAGPALAQAPIGTAEPAPTGPGYAIPGTGLTITGTAAVSNDYLFRGISQTRNNWAYSGTVDLSHESGVYVGAFLSNAKFLANPANDTRQELDILAGYRFELGGINFDIGYVGYFYPGQTKVDDGFQQLNEYHEAVLKATYTVDIVKLSGAFAYSPNFFGRSGEGFYLEGGIDVTLPYEFTAFGRLGYQWIERNFGARQVFGTPDYLWYGIGIQREIYAGFTAAVGWYGTDIKKSECVVTFERADQGQRICEGRVLFTLSKSF